MTGQPSLFDRPEQARIDQADEHAAPAWKTHVERICDEFIASGVLFAASDVWAKLQATGAPVPHEPSAIGGVIRSRSARKLIVKVGDQYCERRGGFESVWQAADPNWPAGAVEFLMVRRRDSLLGVWRLPGGWIARQGGRQLEAATLDAVLDQWKDAA